ncbi:MAG: aminotransferase class I/II-fold pyridoxal phosphate-dependent enzyme [Saprospiraceae bacterium]|nr:aminotransferase class I/II-fold pyridoxal phosphate-dependent enzyme [Saprospiraceae bacterium]
MQLIDLISDTVTKPTPEMLKAMMTAEVGDDVFGEDPTVNRLETMVAEMFGKEAAIFCPSGTMTNQIAIKVNTQPLDELICDVDSHVYQSETGGYAFHSGVAVNLIQGKNGKITVQQIESAIKPGFDWQPTSRLVVLENSCNKGGGSYYTLDEIIPISKLCKERRLRLHLDGARLFNVLVETNESTQDYGKYFDTISICISKGLGAPAGSLLIGSKEDIRMARRYRKVMGGGMRQAGYLAAACIYALQNHVQRLKTDNDRARAIGQVLNNLPYVKNLKPVYTNIVIFELTDNITTDQYLNKLSEKGIRASAFGHQTIRLVTHYDISEEMMEYVMQTLPVLHT